MLRLSMLACIVLIVCLLPTEARTYTVDDNGFADYKIIGKAVMAASNGDTIYIKPGVYSESVTLNKSLNLMPLIGETGDIILIGSDKDIGVKITANGCSLEGITVKNFSKAGIEVQSSNNIIKSCKFEKDSPAILINGASKNLITDNTMTDCVGGVALKYGSRENKITKNEIDGGLVSVYLDDAYNSSILDNYLTGAYRGIWIEKSGNTEAARNDISCRTCGILVANSSTGKLMDNLAARSTWGIYLLNASHVELKNNSIKDVESGIFLVSSLRNTMSENRISKATDTAMYIVYSNNNIFTGNQISKGERGILIAYSSDNKLRNNKLMEIVHGLYVDGESSENFNNSIDESNEIDGKPIAYFYGISGGHIQHRDLAHLTLAGCRNFVVEDNNITNDDLALIGSNDNKIINNNIHGSYGGMLLLNSKANLIQRNRIFASNYSGIYLIISDSNIISENNASKNNQMGISLLNSANNTIRDNTADHNHDTGIWLNSSRDNKVFENDVFNNPVGMQVINCSGNSIYSNDINSNSKAGISLNMSKNNKLYENNISKNAMGAQLAQSTGNEIFHNNFIGNKEQAEDREGDNLWDMGNVTGGNYWSDHSAVGNPSTGWAKLIRGAKKDNYPFQDMNGWLKPKELAKPIQTLIIPGT